MDFNGFLMSGDVKAAEIRSGRILPIDSSRMPLYLTRRDDLDGWLKGRAIDRHRANSRILKKVLRLTDSSDIAAVMRSHAATITDNYWICREGETLTYQDIRFSEDTFAEVALTGSFSSYSRQYREEQLRGNSPELTNIGSYEKCWRLIDGEWWLVKAGTPEERFSEIFISELGTRLGFAMAEYLPDGQFVRTRDFTRGRCNFEPADAIVGEEEDYAFNYERLTELDPRLGKEYLDILFMDALCFNMDRHTKNYGVLRDQSTGKVLCMAPNFDNNIALISRGYGADPGQTNDMLIRLFAELLESEHLEYELPALSMDTLASITSAVLPGENIRRDYVVEMVGSRMRKLEQVLGQQMREPRFEGPQMV